MTDGSTVGNEPLDTVMPAVNADADADADVLLLTIYGTNNAAQEAYDLIMQYILEALPMDY